jgi:hypothetical protein
MGLISSGSRTSRMSQSGGLRLRRMDGLRMSGTPMKIDLPYLMQDVDRHGNVRLYVRRKKVGKVRL